MATLLRTGIIGLKDWIHQVGVLIGSLRCKYGWLRQTLKYIILLCPLRTNQEAMLSVAGIENYNTLLLTQKGLKAVTQWLISQNVLNQFRVIKEIESKGASNRHPLVTLQQQSKVRDTSASVGLLRQQWFPRRSKSKVVEHHRQLAGASQASPKRRGDGSRGFLSEFSPYM